MPASAQSDRETDSPDPRPERLRSLWSRIYPFPHDPVRQCATVSLIGFVLFIAQGIVAIFKHDESTKYICAATSGVILASIIGFVTIRLFTNRRKLGQRRPNLINTVLTCILSIILCMILYPKLWYPSLNRSVLRQNVEDVDKIQPPAMAWIQFKERHDNGFFFNNISSKGFVSDVAGGFDDGAPQCAGISEEQILAVHYCNCSSLFSDVKDEWLPNHTGGVSYQTWIPSGNIWMNTTNSSMVLQVFARHNTTSVPDLWPIPGPMFSIMAFDPSLPFSDAFTLDQAPVAQIPLLASSKIVIRPKLRIGWTSEAYYYYDMEISSIPSLNDVCNVKYTPHGYCYNTVIVQFADMTRTVMARQTAGSPVGVLAQVGGYFALVQFVCWLVSGMALHEGLK